MANFQAKSIQFNQELLSDEKEALMDASVRNYLIYTIFQKLDEDLEKKPQLKSIDGNYVIKSFFASTTCLIIAFENELLYVIDGIKSQSIGTSPQANLDLLYLRQTDGSILSQTGQEIISAQDIERDLRIKRKKLETTRKNQDREQKEPYKSCNYDNPLIEIQRYQAVRTYNLKSGLFPSVFPKQEKNKIKTTFKR